jgi:hypothetical protein
MKKYNSEDYFSVRERRTGRKICDCGDFEDARMLMHMDAPNREIVKNKTLMSPVIDIKIPKALPTNEIVQCGVASSYKIEQPKGSNGPGEPLPQIKLSHGQGKPFKP